MIFVADFFYRPRGFLQRGHLRRRFGRRTAVSASPYHAADAWSGGGTSESEHDCVGQISERRRYSASNGDGSNGAEAARRCFC